MKQIILKIGFSGFLPLLLSFATFTFDRSALAQQDTLFWFAAPEVSSAEGDNPINLRLMSYANAASVTISQPANGAFTPINVVLPANSESIVNLTPFLADIESAGADIVGNTGLKIESDELITAFYEVLAPTSKDAFSLKGNKAIGTNFYTPFQENWDNTTVAPVATFSSFEVVATEDNTTVLITPRTDIVGHTVGSTFSVLLQEGETYSGRDMNITAATSLSGSIISSDNPISVTVFQGALNNASCTSTYGDQITPTDYLGNDYIIHRGKVGDRITILATQNGTGITIEDGTTTTSTLINWGETYEYALLDTFNFIQCSKPVYMLHSSGFGCNLAGAQVPGLFCSGKYEQTFTRSTSDSLGLLLYTRAGFEDDFLLNGSAALIDPSDFTVVPGTSGEFVAALIYYNTADIPVDSYNIVTNSGDIFGLGVLHGEDGNDASYAYLSEFASYPFVDAGPSIDTVCANVPYPINGLVGGGSVTGVWGGTGFGTWEFGLDVLTNTYIPSDLDTLIDPIELIITSTGPCPVQKDTITLYVTPSPIVNAGADQTVCANNADVDLSGSVIGGLSTGVWSTLGSGTFTPDANTLDATYVPSDADTTAGTVTLVLTSDGVTSCNTETDTMVVTITPAPVVDAGTDSIYVCENNAGFSLSGTVFGGSSTGKWTTSGNGAFSPDNLSLSCDYTPTPTDIASGEIIIYLESTGNGSCNPAIDSIIVTFTPSPVVYAGGDLIACNNNPVVDLSGTVSGPTTSGIWSGGTGTYSPDDTDLSATYTPSAAEVTAGTAILTLTSTANGTCTAETDQVQITFVAPPFANFNFNEVCMNEETNFTDFSLNGFGFINSWDWDFGDGNSSTSQNPNHNFSTFGSQIVQLIVTSDAGCSDTVEQVVNVFEIPTADFSWEASCDNDQVIIDFTDESTTSSDLINYWFYDFGGVGSQAVENPSQLFIGEGDFFITHIVETENGCSDTIVQIVNIPPRPEAGFYYNTSNGQNIGAEFTFIDTSLHSTSWAWDFGNGETSENQDPSTTYFANGTYTVTQWAYGELGCVDSTSTQITINTVTTEIDKLIPNAISPNGDGKNDVWKLNFIQFLNPNAEIVVFNRWGQTLYQSVGYSDPWDGTYRGELVPEGTYFYIIKISDDEIYEGTILVLISNDE
ncbi:MAG: PKD domain-containing protein [Flavobacteriales bacterium]|nr:PKD domain-containing protein [Flavobacteriales bacterium]